MKQNLTTKTQRIEDNSVVIKKFIKGIEGGRTLDVEGYALDVIQAGHVIITDGNNAYKPMPLNEGATAYGALPEGFKYAGVLYSGVLKDKAAAPIMTWGIVNEVALPFAMDAIMVAFKKDCPYIDFAKDEEA